MGEAGSKGKSKGKAPAFQFYVMDFMTDADGLTATSNGIWIRMLCKLHRARKRGETTATVKAWCLKCNCTAQQLQKFILENEVEQVADLTFNDNKMTVVSRRMERERRERESGNKRQREYEARRKADGSVTDECKNLTCPSSSSSSSSSSNNNIVQKSDYTEDFKAFWDPYPRKLHKPAAFLCWKTRLKQGVKPSDLISAAGNYAKHVKGRTLNHMLLASTFLGPQELFADYINGVPEVDNSPRCGNCEFGPQGNADIYCSQRARTVSPSSKRCPDRYKRRNG